MKKLIALAAFGSLFAAANAVTLIGTIDVTGIQSWDGYDDPDNVANSFNLDAVFGQDYSNYVLTGIGWDVTLTGLGLSWQSELAVAFENSDFTDGVFLRPGAGTNVPGTSSFNSGGIVDLIAPGLDVTINADDMFEVQFFESFDDVANAVDGTWDRGTLTLQFEAVPEPATLAVLGLGAAAMLRRRRK